MADQAERLRERLKPSDQTNRAYTIAIASGKGGVGKSNFSINFALKLVEQHKKVLIIDMDIGMGNIDILLGVSPSYSFIDLFNEGRSIHDIIEIGPNALAYIAGGSGLSQIFQMNEEMFSVFQKQFTYLSHSYDYIVFDMGAGATHDSLRFISAADEAIIVTTPEPTSITDGYAMIKHLVQKDKGLPISILVNRSLKVKQDQTYKRMGMVVQKFLNKQIASLGVIPDDRHVMKAVQAQTPFVLLFPSSAASKAVDRAVQQFMIDRNKAPESSEGTFLSKLKSFIFER